MSPNIIRHEGNTSFLEKVGGVSIGSREFGVMREEAEKVAVAFTVYDAMEFGYCRGVGRRKINGLVRRQMKEQP